VIDAKGSSARPPGREVSAGWRWHAGCSCPAAKEAAMAFLEDTDQDGHVVDQGFEMGADLLGGFYKGCGGLAMGAGGLLCGLAGAEAMTGFGMPAAVLTGLTGGALTMAGGLGVAAGELLQTDFMGNVAAEVGDFTQGLFGTPIAPGTPG
jgi:hypothetical protein